MGGEWRGRGAHDKLESLDGNTNLRFRPATFSQPYFRNFLALVWRVASITIVIVPRNCAGLPLERELAEILALVLINRVQHESGWSIPANLFSAPYPKVPSRGEIQGGREEIKENSDFPSFFVNSLVGEGSYITLDAKEGQSFEGRIWLNSKRVHPPCIQLQDSIESFHEFSPHNDYIDLHIDFTTQKILTFRKK